MVITTVLDVCSFVLLCNELRVVMLWIYFCVTAGHVAWQIRYSGQTIGQYMWIYSPWWFQPLLVVLLQRCALIPVGMLHQRTWLQGSCVKMMI